MARIQTLHGLAPSAEELTDDDILEVDGEAPRVVITVPPPSGTRYVKTNRHPPPSGTRYLQTNRYSVIAPRSTKKPTLRLVGDDD